MLIDANESDRIGSVWTGDAYKSEYVHKSTMHAVCMEMAKIAAGNIKTQAHRSN